MSRSTADPFEQAQRVADAVLWEGYVLYPYRASAAKNQVRWQYGVLAPGPTARPTATSAGRCRPSASSSSGSRPRSTCGSGSSRCRPAPSRRRSATDFKPVAELEVDGELWASWDEAVEHTLDVAGFDLARPGMREVPIALAGGREVEALGERGRVVRERWPVDAVGATRVRALPGPLPAHQAAGDGGERHRLARAPTCPATRPCAARSSPSTRSLHSDDARFISLLEPPEFARAAVETCTNEGTFPVLVGDPERARPPCCRRRSSSTTIPAVAAESPGDMCDATEIDEILALRILTLTDDEKRLARSTDPRAAAIVDRIEGFSPEVFASLHGEMRADRRAATPSTPTCCRGGSRPSTPR